MSLLQVNVDDNLKKANLYGVPASSLIKIVLVKSFIEEEDEEAGNVFNANRDNDGKGVKIDDLISKL